MRRPPRRGAGRPPARRPRAPAPRTGWSGVRSCGQDIAGPRGVPPPPSGIRLPKNGARDLVPETQQSWRRPIFPKGCPLSILGAGELNFRVRDGNGCGLSARVTRIRASDRVPSAAAPPRAISAREAPGSSMSRTADALRPVYPNSFAALTLGQSRKRSSPRPLVRLSFIRCRTSTRRLSNRWSPCGLTRLTRWGTSSRGELRT